MFVNHSSRNVSFINLAFVCTTPFEPFKLKGMETRADWPNDSVEFYLCRMKACHTNCPSWYLSKHYIMHRIVFAQLLSRLGQNEPVGEVVEFVCTTPFKFYFLNFIILNLKMNV